MIDNTMLSFNSPVYGPSIMVNLVDFGYHFDCQIRFKNFEKRKLYDGNF